MAFFVCSRLKLSVCLFFGISSLGIALAVLRYRRKRRQRSNLPVHIQRILHSRNLIGHLRFRSILRGDLRLLRDPQSWNCLSPDASSFLFLLRQWVDETIQIERWVFFRYSLLTRSAVPVLVLDNVHWVGFDYDLVSSYLIVEVEKPGRIDLIIHDLRTGTWRITLQGQFLPVPVC